MDTKIYFDLPDEILEVLNDNGLTIAQILEKEGLDVQVSRDVQPIYEGESAQTKSVVEVATLIVASSGLIVSVAYAVSKTLNAVYNKPYLVSFYENEELRDASGNLVFNKDGSPVYKINKKYKLIEPKEDFRNENIEFKSGFKDGIVIRFESKNGE
jgi:hypothetical protein